MLPSPFTLFPPFLKSQLSLCLSLGWGWRSRTCAHKSSPRPVSRTGWLTDWVTGLLALSPSSPLFYIPHQMIITSTTQVPSPIDMQTYPQMSPGCFSRLFFHLLTLFPSGFPLLLYFLFPFFSSSPSLAFYHLESTCWFVSRLLACLWTNQGDFFFSPQVLFFGIFFFQGYPDNWMFLMWLCCFAFVCASAEPSG